MAVPEIHKMVEGLPVFFIQLETDLLVLWIELIYKEFLIYLLCKTRVYGLNISLLDIPVNGKENQADRRHALLTINDEIFIGSCILGLCTDNTSKEVIGPVILDKVNEVIKKLLALRESLVNT